MSSTKSKRTRRKHSSEQKAALLKKHHVEKVAVSDICDQAELQPSLFYIWQRQLFENAGTVFDGPAKKSGAHDRHDREKPKTRGPHRAARGEARRTDAVMAEISEEFVKTRTNSWGALKGRWVPHETRDEVIDFVHAWWVKTEVAADRFISGIDVARGNFFEWRRRCGRANEHNALVLRDHWIELESREKIVTLHDQNPLEGYRRLTFMMLDADVAWVSSATTSRVLRAAGQLDHWNRKPSKKGTGFVQPLAAH